MAPLSFLIAALSLVVALVAGSPTPQLNATGGSTIQNLSVPITNPNSRDIIPNKYIVVYDETFSDDIVTAHQAKWITTMAKRNVGKRSLADNRPLSTTIRTFGIGTMRAMALDADDQSAIEINSAACVKYIEADAYVSINAMVTQANAPSGLARLSSAAPGGTNYVFDDSAGQGITAFIVDTGIMVNHTEFGGRATFAFNSANNVDTDQNGHGTHVAGEFENFTSQYCCPDLLTSLV